MERTKISPWDLVLSNPVLDYAWIKELVSLGSFLPESREEPVTVDRYSDGNLVVADGNHFVAACRQLDISDVEVQLRSMPYLSVYAPIFANPE